MPSKVPEDLTKLNPFGRLTALCRVERGPTRWLCRCSCPEKTELVVCAGNLKGGTTQSCGCLQRERTGDANRTHGDSGSPEYSAWNEMKKRCYNKKNKRYSRYGGRGIVVCKRWLLSYENFLADVGRRPSPAHSLERKDNDGNYTPRNVVWATKEQQANNRGTNTVLMRGGRSQTLQQWARELHIPRETLSTRLRAGWSMERTLRG
jgi:hypothetical protein